MTTAIFHAMFYCHLQPMILLIVTVNTSVFIIIMKYMLLRRCKIPDLTSFEIFQYSTYMLSLAPAYYFIGSIFFILIDDTVQITSEGLLLFTIPYMVCLLIWFLAVLDVGSIFTNFNHWLVHLLLHDNMTSSGRRKKVRRESDILSSQSGFNKNWSRKECYYMDSPVNTLL